MRRTTKSPRARSDAESADQCDGRLLSIRDYVPLFSIIGNLYGGDGTTTFALPDLRGSVPVGANANQAIGKFGGIGSGTGQPTLALQYLIAIDGIYPSRD